jgi:hypothetical protein
LLGLNGSEKARRSSSKLLRYLHPADAKPCLVAELGRLGAREVELGIR